MPMTPSDSCPCLIRTWQAEAPIQRQACGGTLSDYTQMLLDLLPQGAVWRQESGTEGGSIQSRVLEAAAETTLLPADQRFCHLVEEADPRTSDEILSRWERWLGLPDACFPPVSGLEARRQRVVTVENATGGNSRAYFTALAALLGFDIDIEEPFPFGAGCHRAGMRRGCCCAWVVHVRCAELPAGTTVEAQAALLECLFNRLKPAHTSVFFRYDSRWCRGPVDPRDPDPCRGQRIERQRLGFDRLSPTVDRTTHRVDAVYA